MRKQAPPVGWRPRVSTLRPPSVDPLKSRWQIDVRVVRRLPFRIFRAVGGNGLFDLHHGYQPTTQLVPSLLGEPCHEPGIAEHEREPLLFAYLLRNLVTEFAVGKVFEGSQPGLHGVRSEHPLRESFCRRFHALPAAMFAASRHPDRHVAESS